MKAMPTPVHDVAHTGRALLLMNVMQFIEDNVDDGGDAYGERVSLSFGFFCSSCSLT